jgi:hypothetical protein
MRRRAIGGPGGGPDGADGGDVRGDSSGLYL